MLDSCVYCGLIRPFWLVSAVKRGARRRPSPSVALLMAFLMAFLMALLMALLMAMRVGIADLVADRMAHRVAHRVADLMEMPMLDRDRLSLSCYLCSSVREREQHQADCEREAGKHAGPPVVACLSRQ